MQHASKQVPPGPSNVQRAIVLLLLGHTDGLARPEVSAELDDFDPNAVRDGLAGLEDEGVVVADEDRVRASRCARRLDALGLICV